MNIAPLSMDNEVVLDALAFFEELKEDFQQFEEMFWKMMHSETKEDKNEEFKLSHGEFTLAQTQLHNEFKSHFEEKMVCVSMHNSGAVCF